MFKRPLWLGLLLGSLAAFSLLRQRPALTDCHAALFDLTSDALVRCDAAGTIQFANAAAHQLFGPDCAGLSFLCYPNGQRVPPGQLPHTRGLRSGQSAANEYHLHAPGGEARVLEVSALALPSGGAAAVFREVTALHRLQAYLDQAQARQTALHRLGRRLGAATSDAIGRVVAEEVHALLGGLPDVQVRLYGYNPAAQILTRLASEPEDRPKRPKTMAEAQPPVFPFDADTPAMWQLYVDRQPSFTCWGSLGEAEAASACALPLLVDGVAIGHLSVSSSATDAFDDLPLLQALTVAASAAALALSVPQAKQLAESSTAQLDTVREIAEAVAQGAAAGQLAELVSVQVRRVTNAALCTVSIEDNGKLCVLGEAFRDDLLHPERGKPTDPMLQSKAAQKAWRTQKMASHLGLTNPSLEKGQWRAFAGREGKHSIFALPLADRRGVLAVYWDGAMPLPEAQIKFLQLVAALASLGLKPATNGEVGAG